MSQRIRYEQSEIQGCVKSVRVFKSADNREFRVWLSLENKKYFIKDATTDATVAEGSGVSLAMLKLRAKRGLADLGVEFSEETRGRGEQTPA